GHGGQPDPQARRFAELCLHPGVARHQGHLRDRRLRLPAGRRPRRRRGHPRRTARFRRPERAAVPRGRHRRADRLPLPGAAARRRPGAEAMNGSLLAPLRLLMDFLVSVGQATRFFLRLCLLGLASLRRPRLVIDQVHFIGNYSLSIILVSGLLIGFVLGLQGYYTLRRYGSEEALGVLVTLSLVRELGPVVTALLFAGRAGTSLTAEVGLMKAGEQIDAMEMMAVDPVARVLAPRFAAA